MNENLGDVLDWLYPGKTNIGFFVERRDDGVHVIAEWIEEIMGVPKPTEAEVLTREGDWMAWRDSIAGIAFRNLHRLPSETTAALVEVVASQQAGETPPVWATDMLMEAQTVIRNG